MKRSAYETQQQRFRDVAARLAADPPKAPWDAATLRKQYHPSARIGEVQVKGEK